MWARLDSTCLMVCGRETTFFSSIVSRDIVNLPDRKNRKNPFRPICSSFLIAGSAPKRLRGKVRFDDSPPHLAIMDLPPLLWRMRIRLFRRGNRPRNHDATIMT